MRHPRLAALVVVVLVVTGGGYTLWQPLRPELIGGGAGFTVAHVGSTYVCGGVLALGSDERPLRVVRARAVGIPRDAADVRLLVTSPRSALYATGALGLRRPPAYDDEGVGRPADFTLHEDGGPRVHLAVTPRRLGEVELEAVEVTYRTRRWLPTVTVTVPSGCSLDVTRTGADPNIAG